MKTLEISDVGTVKLQRHRRAKCLKLRVQSDRTVRVTLPWFCTYGQARSFAESRKDWILTQLEKLPHQAPLSESDLEQLRSQARAYIVPQVKKFSAEFGFEYGVIRIKNIRSRWGSCSAQKNLNFSLYLMRLEPQYINYVILHELCHTVHMNHGPDFWKLLEQVCPGAKKIDQQMRDFVL